MKPIWFVVLSIAFAVGLYSCSKGRSYPYEPPKGPQAGKGGLITLNVIPNHKGINIDSGTILIKYNALNYPDSTYDDSLMIKPQNGTNSVQFHALKPGNYFIFGYGWNNITSEQIWGSTPVIINDSNTYYTVELLMRTK
jgi:hypothetical protein